MTGPAAHPGPRPPGWLTGEDGVPYPPAPWHLGATLLAGVFPVDAARLPPAVTDAVPAGVEPVIVSGRAVVGVAFVHYHPGGVLSYRELLAGLLCRGRRGAPRVSIGQIWVDSPASRAGGRALWGIPKDLARFEWDDAGAGEDGGDRGLRCSAHLPDPEGDVPVAALSTGPLGRAVLPWPVRLPLTTAQRAPASATDAGAPRITAAWAVARPRLLPRAEWSFAPEGPLAYLGGCRPRLRIALVGVTMTFGSGVRR